jgi:hypothetical protein
MKKEKMMKPPYTSTGQAEEVLNIFRRISPKKIDSRFIIENNITTAPNASAVVNFAKWMEIINLDGDVNQEISNKLRLVGKDRNEFIKELIETAYEEVLEGINLTEASRDDVTNFFIHNYGFGLSQAKSAAILFLHLCQRYGIQISDELKKKTHIGGGSGKRKKVTKKDNNHIKKQDNKEINLEEEINDGEFILSLKGNGLNKSIRVSTKEELESAYEKKFKDFVSAAKFLFPEENTLKEDESDSEINQKS